MLVCHDRKPISCMVNTLQTLKVIMYMGNSCWPITSVFQTFSKLRAKIRGEARRTKPFSPFFASICFRAALSLTTRLEEAKTLSADDTGTTPRFR